jgi:DNA-binding beta-propeller fold protein YncE
MTNWILLVLAGCGGTAPIGVAPSRTSDPQAIDDPAPRGTPDDVPEEPEETAHLPLVLDADVALPVAAVGFDYQDIDAELGHLVIAHSDDGSVDVVDLADGTMLAEIKGIPTARGVVVADDVGMIFVTSSPHELVTIDNDKLTEIARVPTGNSPDGVAWDPVDDIVGVSDQDDGALSLIPDAGRGTRVQIPLGVKTGNVAFDATRGVFWITVVQKAQPDQLQAVDPTDGTLLTSFDLPDCTGAHGLRLHPDAQSAFVACEGNDTLVRVDLASGVQSTGATGAVPDVMVVDPKIGWLYVAAESGDLAVFDIRQPGVAPIGHDSPGDDSHTIAADPTTHRVYFPLQSGPDGTPVLRIMHPSGS